MVALTNARILIVDDQESNVLLLRRLLERAGYMQIASTTNPGDVVGLFEDRPPDLLLLDLQMPGMDGFAVMAAIEGWTRGEASVPVLVLTADASQATKLRALDAGARDFLSKPFDAVEASLRIRNLLETRRLQLNLQTANDRLEQRVAERTRELAQARIEAFRRLALAAEYRDDDTRQHTKRVGVAAGLLADELGLDSAVVQIIEMAAPLHDIGKIGIPDAILLKPGRLTDDERAVMETHAVIGAEILAGTSSSLLEAAAEIALTHHERWDGTGYPAGLAQEHIPVSGRIVALADAFDAMTHARPYKSAITVGEAVARIESSSGSHFDPAVVAAFRRLDPNLLSCPPLASAREVRSDVNRQALGAPPVIAA